MPASSSDITRIVLTGGPCAGKTTILAHVKSHFSARGYQVFVVPEAATLIINAGFIPSAFPGDHIYELQDAILELTLTLYRQTERLVRHLGQYPALVVYDRGNLDAKAYCTPAAWLRTLRTRNISEPELRDHPYHGIIHLVTTADGAEEHYSTANNAARRETLEDARAIDLLLREAWQVHPHFKMVDNSTPFEGKIGRTIEAIHAILDSKSSGKTALQKNAGGGT